MDIANSAMDIDSPADAGMLLRKLKQRDLFLMMIEQRNYTTAKAMLAFQRLRTIFYNPVLSCMTIDRCAGDTMTFIYGSEYTDKQTRVIYSDYLSMLRTIQQWVALRQHLAADMHALDAVRTPDAQLACIVRMNELLDAANEAQWYSDPSSLFWKIPILDVIYTVR